MPALTPRPWSRISKVLAPAVAAMVLAAACGGTSDDGGADDTNGAGSDRAVLLEPASSSGPDPFTDSVAGGAVLLTRGAREGGAIQAGNAPGLYGGTGDQAVCDQEQLVAFLEANPDKAAAWAEVEGVETDGIGDYVGSLTPAVLRRDTQVTNHGFSDGRATAHQSVLQAGTAVLIDRFGIPRTRCACGNPLLEPHPVADPTYGGDPWPGWEPPPIGIVPATPGSDPVPGVPDAPEDLDFCTVYEEGRPTVEGGPSGPDDVLPYVMRLEAYFADLIAAAQATDGFPADALADLIAYHDDLVAAIAAGDPSAIAGSTVLRDEIEAFLEAYCANPPEPGGISDDPVPDDPVPNGECGSFMFFLLIEAAEGLGVDWQPVGQPFLDQLDALTGSPESDLSTIIEFEEIGCEGAQAVYDLLVEQGFADALGPFLDPYA